PAALFMVIAKTLIKNRALMGGSPSDVLSYANDQLCEGNEAELFVTVWFGILEISTGKGVAANAGHEHPAIRRKDGKFELVVYRHSPAVATMEGIPFKQHEFELHPGDSLFVYTDGVAEATNAHDELYGTDRMLEALNRNPDATAEELLKTVRESIDEFVGDAPQFDDITMLGLNYFGK
ncbi:MAG: serine/threonine-protein phosphatase, partial [Lachnospiraceae bacterium]|nr:serine/threonine-protein phosphatase [Lachnospiraceae bacterium]